MGAVERMSVSNAGDLPSFLVHGNVADVWWQRFLLEQRRFPRASRAVDASVDLHATIRAGGRETGSNGVWVSVSAVCATGDGESALDAGPGRSGWERETGHRMADNTRSMTGPLYDLLPPAMTSMATTCSAGSSSTWRGRG